MIGLVETRAQAQGQSRSRNSAQGDKWSFCLTAGTLCLRIRSDNEQKNTPEPHTGLQGEGGARRREGRSNAGSACRSLGMPRLRVEFKFCSEDASSAVRAHELLDEALRKNRVGHLEYRVGVERRFEAVMQQASDGFHQLGTTRMGLSPMTSVVDTNCQVHGLKNLFVASTSVFPTSGQANPTFLGVAIAFRLGAFLKRRL